MFISGVGDSWGHLGVCWGLLVSSSGHLGAIAGLFKCRAHSYAGSVAVVCQRVLRPYMLAALGMLCLEPSGKLSGVCLPLYSIGGSIQPRP